jgi:hypothetical protein
MPRLFPGRISNVLSRIRGPIGISMYLTYVVVSRKNIRS